MRWTYDIRDRDGGGRVGQFSFRGKQLTTPTLLPVLSPFHNGIPPSALASKFGVQAVFTNAYIIYNSQQREEIAAAGLHRHLGFDGLVATDSGGFQHYMYGGDLEIAPAEIEAFQERLGADFPVILDIPVQTSDSPQVARQKVEESLRRARDNTTRRTTDAAWFGPVHGSVYPDLLRQSAEGMSVLDFPVFALGGLVKAYIDYRFDLVTRTILTARPHLDPTRPVHLFGLGLPAFFALAVACGADMFDSAAYILYAKDNRYFTLGGTRHLRELVELPCTCPVCSSHTSQELRDLGDPERTTALAEHNLHVSFGEIRAIRQAIREGTLWELVEQRCLAHPKLIRALRVVRDHLGALTPWETVQSPRGVKILGEDSLYRPILEITRHRLVANHAPLGVSRWVVLPELDVPPKSSPSFRKWLAQITEIVNQPGQGPKTQIYIASNILGLFPIQVLGIFPMSQHEGDVELYPGTPACDLITGQVCAFLERHLRGVEEVVVFCPPTYTDENHVERPLRHHLIHLLSPAMADADLGELRPRVVTCDDLGGLVAHLGP